MRIFLRSSLLWHACIDCTVKTVLLSAAVFFYLIPALAQSYYPGGLGNTNLIVWLNAGKSSSITQSAGAVSQWSDLSGRNYHFSQATSARQPAYSATGGPNSRPAISFTGASQHYLSTPSIPASISYTSGVSSFAVVNFATPLGGGFPRIYDFAIGQSNNSIWYGRYWTNTTMGYEGRTDWTVAQTYTNGTAILANGTHSMHEVIQQGGTVGNTSAVTFYRAGTSWTSTGTMGSTTYVPAATNRTSNFIARSNWSADEYFGGTMSEILFYNLAMNTTRRIILENYLWASWGLAVNTTRYTPPATGVYGTNLVGIGYTSTTDNFLTDVSGSTDGLGFSSTTTATGFLNTAGYVMAAHNQQANTVNSGISMPGIGNNLYRWNRSWNIQQTGGNSSGTISVQFNFSDYSGTTPNSTYSYGILYNATDGTFATGTNQLVSTNATVSGSIVSFPVTASNLPAGYYTIVWSATSILPVVLTNFTATGQDNGCLLQWSTAQETNSSHFEVQRAVDGVSFSTIGQVAAKGYSTSLSRYSFTDQYPAAGHNYYRLKMVDANGAISYSAVRMVDRGGAGLVTPEVYFNSSTGVLRITGLVTTGMVTVRMINAAGQLVKRVQQPAAGVMDVAMELAGGWYMAEISSGNKVYRKKIIRQ